MCFSDIVYSMVYCTCIIGRAGASPPSRTAAIVFLYNIYNYILYLFLILKFQFYALPFASCIQRKRNLRVTSRIRRTRPPLRHYVITITSSREPNRGSSALPRPSSYTAAPRRMAPGPSNLCPSYLTTLVTIHSSYGCLVKIYIYM